MREPVLSLRRATVWRGETRVFHRLSLRVAAGESLVVLGGNGAGKSTLLALIAGEVRVAAEEGSEARLFGDEHWSLEELRGRVGVVMPEKARLFHPEEPAGDVVLSALRGAHGRTRQMRFSLEEKRKAARAIRAVKMGRLSERAFGELSSGEQRRFLVARALVHEPEVLVLDEPTTALDLPGAIGLLEVVRDLIRKGTAVIMVTHDAREIPPEIGRVVLLKNGKVLADGRKREVMSSDLLSRCYGMDLEVRWRRGHCEVHPAGR